MKITAIEAFPVEIPLKPERRMVSALGRHEVSRFVLVRVETDDGLVGVGEATATPQWSGETVWGCEAMISTVLAPVVIGCDPAAIEEIDQRMDRVTVDNWFAKSAIEMACWDLQGQAAGKPVYELLGGAQRPLRVRNRFSMGAYPPEVAAERARERVAAGFQTIKIKVGTDPETDIQRVQAVREAVGDDIELTIDANGGWNEERALYCWDSIQHFGVTLVEQPLPRGNYTGLKRLREATGFRVLADESCFDEVEAEELIAHECCDAITVYPGKHGGIRKAVRIAERAEAAGLPCTIGSNLEWDVGAATMMHFIVGCRNMQVESIPGDCLGPFYHEFSIARNPLTIDGPFTEIRDEPGLGIDVDWERVKQHRISR